MNKFLVAVGGESDEVEFYELNLKKQQIKRKEKVNCKGLMSRLKFEWDEDEFGFIKIDTTNHQISFLRY